MQRKYELYISKVLSRHLLWFLRFDTKTVETLAAKIIKWELYQENVKIKYKHSKLFWNISVNIIKDFLTFFKIFSEILAQALWACTSHAILRRVLQYLPSLGFCKISHICEISYIHEMWDFMEAKSWEIYTRFQSVSNICLDRSIEPGQRRPFSPCLSPRTTAGKKIFSHKLRKLWRQDWCRMWLSPTVVARLLVPLSIGRSW